MEDDSMPFEVTAAVWQASLPSQTVSTSQVSSSVDVTSSSKKSVSKRKQQQQQEQEEEADDSTSTSDVAITRKSNNETKPKRTTTTSETGRRGSKSKRKRGESSSSSAGGGGPGGSDTKRGRADQRALNIDALQRTYAPRHVLTPLELRNVLAALASLIHRHGELPDDVMQLPADTLPRLSVRGRAATETSEKDDSESEDDDDDDDDDDDEQSAGSFTSIAPADNGIVCALVNEACVAAQQWLTSLNNKGKRTSSNKQQLTLDELRAAPPLLGAKVKRITSRLVRLLQSLQQERRSAAKAAGIATAQRRTQQEQAIADRDEQYKTLRTTLAAESANRDRLVAERQRLLTALANTRAALAHSEIQLGALAQRVAAVATAFDRDAAHNAAAEAEHVACRRAARRDARALATLMPTLGSLPDDLLQQQKEIAARLRACSRRRAALPADSDERAQLERDVALLLAHADVGESHEQVARALARVSTPRSRLRTRGSGRLALVYHDVCIEHHTPALHREQPARVRTAINACRELAALYPTDTLLESQPPRVDSRFVEGVVHAPSYVDELAKRLPPPGSQVMCSVEDAHRPSHADADNHDVNSSAAPTMQDQTESPDDTYLSPMSLTAAYLAAGSVCRAVELVSERDADSDNDNNDNSNDDDDNDSDDDEATGQRACRAAFCAVRPPGHHVGRHGLTEGVESQGYCVLNNVAIGAQYAMLKYDYERVAIVDFDVHHGNGTEEIFRGHSNVLFASVHVYAPEIEFYPCTGPPEDVSPLPPQAAVAAPPARSDGNVLNVPISVGVTSAQFRAVFDDVVVPALHKFKPDLVLLSAGFDGHRDDPYGQWIGSDITADDYAAVTSSICDAARKHKAPIISVLEGGYNLNALYNNVKAHITALGGF